MGRLLVVLGLLATASPMAAQEPGLTVSAWLQRVQGQVYPYRVSSDWFLLPAAEPGVAADLIRVIDGPFPPEIRARAVRALGQLAGEASIAVPKLGELLGHDEEQIRREAVGAFRHFGRAAQDELWTRARDLTLVLNPPRSDSHVPATVSLYAVAALATLPEVEPRPLIEDYRRAVDRGQWIALKGSAEFLGSVAHLKSILTEVFRSPHESTAIHLAAFFSDPDPVVRQLALNAAPVIRDAAPILAEITRSLATATADEKQRFAKLLRYGGRGAVPMLVALLEVSVGAAADALQQIFWEESMDYVIGELGKGATPRLRHLVLQVLLNRLNGQTYPQSLERELLGSVGSFFRDAQSIDDLNRILFKGKLRRNSEGNVMEPDQASPRVWRLPPPVVRSLAEGLVALPVARAEAAQILEVLVLLGIDAGTDRVAAWVRSLAPESPPEDRAVVALYLAALGRPPDDLAVQIPLALRAAGQRDLDSLSEPIIAETESGAQFLRALIMAVEDEHQAERVATPVFWRLFATAKDPAPFARTVRSGARSARVRALAEAVLSYAGTVAERAEIGPKIDLPMIQNALDIRGEERAAALLAGAAPVTKRAAMALVAASQQRDSNLQALVKALCLASTWDRTDFPWEPELASLADRVHVTRLQPLHQALLRTPTGRTALRSHLETLLTTAAREDPRDWKRNRIDQLDTGLQTVESLPTVTPPVTAAVRSLAADRRVKPLTRTAALVALARCDPHTLETQNIWAQAVQDPEAEIRQAALSGIEKVLGQLPHLRPVWLAGLMREREEEQNRRDGIWRTLAELAAESAAAAKKKEAGERPAPSPAVPTATSAASQSATTAAPEVSLGELERQMQASTADVPGLVEDAARKRPDQSMAIFNLVLVNKPSQGVAAARRLVAVRPSSLPGVAVLLLQGVPGLWLQAVSALAADQPDQAAVLVYLSNRMPNPSAATLSAAAAASKRTEAELAAEAEKIARNPPMSVVAATTTAGNAASSPPTAPQASQPVASTPSAEMQAFQQIYFPWPPPPPVIWDEFGGEDAPLKRRWLGGENSTLGEVEERLQSSLGATYGDLEAGLFPVPGGFALVTRIERIKSTGQPYSGAYRWSPADNIRPDWPVWMFYEVPGYFRKIVFVVTSDFLPKWRVGFVIPDPGAGAKSLPPELKQKNFKDLKAYVLVYSYQRRPSGLYYPFGTLTAAQHVRMTGMLRYFDPAPLQ